MFDPKDSKTVGYHLFFLPERELFDSLQNAINTLAEKYGGAKFEPHITLLARIPKADEAELIAKTQQLASIMIASLSFPASMKFLADKVYLHRTEGEAQDWVRIGAYPLGE